MSNKTETRTIEKEKFFAEKLNGRFAMPVSYTHLTLPTTPYV